MVQTRFTYMSFDSIMVQTRFTYMSFDSIMVQTRLLTCHLIP